MQRHGVDDEEAFRLLRKESMARRNTVEELSQQIVESPEERGRAPMAKAERAGGLHGHPQRG